MIRNLVLLTLLSFACYNTLFATAAKDAKSGSTKTKHYINPKDVVFTEDGIWLDLPSGPRMIQNINFDAIGCYYNYYNKKGAWQCPKCKGLNQEEDAICRYCDWPED